MNKNATLKTLNEQEVQASFPPNYKEWVKNKNDTIYDEILEEIENLGNQAIINNILFLMFILFPKIELLI